MVLLDRHSEQKPNSRSDCSLSCSPQTIATLQQFLPRFPPTVLTAPSPSTRPVFCRSKPQSQTIFSCSQQVFQKDPQLPAIRPPLKGSVAVFRAAASPRSASSRELLPACWPEPPPAGWSCSGSVDEAAVLPQAVGHDQPSPRHRLATALWASTSSSMNAEIHCPRLEEKIAAQGSPSNPSIAAPTAADSRLWAENPRCLGYQKLRLFELLYIRLEIALFSPVKLHADICVHSGNKTQNHFKLLL